MKDEPDINVYERFIKPIKEWLKNKEKEKKRRELYDRLHRYDGTKVTQADIISMYKEATKMQKRSK